MRVKVLLNPYANRWKARKRWPEAEAALTAAGVDFDLSISDHPDHLIGLAAQSIVQGFGTIIVAGGDGSVGETLNGIGSHWDEGMRFPVTLGLLPLGSANDLAYSLGVPLELGKAAAIVAAGQSKAVDLCKCNDRYFINNSAVALEPYVTTKHERIRWIKGSARYLAAALWAIMDKPEWNSVLAWDDEQYRGPLSLASVGNGRRTGGFFMTPHANPFDGKLTLAFGYRASRLGLLLALPRAFKEGVGNYVEMEGMREVQCTKLRIHLDRLSPAHVDGELFDEWLSDFEYKILPSAVPILLP
jgi:diacylglycerol kinase (ATP)